MKISSSFAVKNIIALIKNYGFLWSAKNCFNKPAFVKNFGLFINILNIFFITVSFSDFIEGFVRINFIYLI